MKKLLLKPYVLLILSLITFSACQEEEIDSVFFRTDGGISTVIKDAEGQAIPDAKVALYNYRTENIIDQGYTDEKGHIDFGRLEAGEYSIFYEFRHQDEFFEILEEVHVISGMDKQHEVNVADHYGDLAVRIFDNGTGELIEFDIDAKIGLLPIDDDYVNLSDYDQVLDLIQYSFDAEGQLDISDLPEATYVVVVYNEGQILYTNSAKIDPFQKKFVNFGVNPLSLLLSSKPSWVVSGVTADSNPDNVFPISSISFGQNETMQVNYENGENNEAYFYMNSTGGFDWYNLGTNTFYFNFSEDFYEINSDGSISFHFNYWETYNNNDGTWHYAENVTVILS